MERSAVARASWHSASGASNGIWNVAVVMVVIVIVVAVVVVVVVVVGLLAQRLGSLQNTADFCFVQRWNNKRVKAETTTNTNTPNFPTNIIPTNIA